MRAKRTRRLPYGSPTGGFQILPSGVLHPIACFIHVKSDTLMIHFGESFLELPMRRLLLAVLSIVAVTFGAGSLSAEENPKTVFKTIPVTLSMEAGSGEFVSSRPEGGKVHHSGIGYLDPYGPASYTCGIDYPEAKRFPYPDFFTKSFNDAYDSDGYIFCVYTVQEGAIYTYDSIAGRVSTTTEGRKDEIVNVIVGGSGAFEGATGLWVGLTQGQGKVSEVAPGRKLPQSILKLMNGYVRVPVK